MHTAATKKVHGSAESISAEGSQVDLETSVLPAEEFSIQEEAADLIYEIIDFAHLMEMACESAFAIGLGGGHAPGAIQRAAARVRGNAEKLLEYL